MKTKKENSLRARSDKLLERIGAITISEDPMTRKIINTYYGTNGKKISGEKGKELIRQIELGTIRKKKLHRSKSLQR